MSTAEPSPAKHTMSLDERKRARREILAKEEEEFQREAAARSTARAKERAQREARRQAHDKEDIEFEKARRATVERRQTFRIYRNSSEQLDKSQVGVRQGYPPLQPYTRRVRSATIPLSSSKSILQTPRPTSDGNYDDSSKKKKVVFDLKTKVITFAEDSTEAPAVTCNEMVQLAAEPEADDTTDCDSECSETSVESADPGTHPSCVNHVTEQEKISTSEGKTIDLVAPTDRETDREVLSTEDRNAMVVNRTVSLEAHTPDDTGRPEMSQTSGSVSEDAITRASSSNVQEPTRYGPRLVTKVLDVNKPAADDECYATAPLLSESGIEKSRADESGTGIQGSSAHATRLVTMITKVLDINKSNADDAIVCAKSDVKESPVDSVGHVRKYSTTGRVSACIATSTEEPSTEEPCIRRAGGPEPAAARALAPLPNVNVTTKEDAPGADACIVTRGQTNMSRPVVLRVPPTEAVSPAMASQPSVETEGRAVGSLVALRMKAFSDPCLASHS